MRTNGSGQGSIYHFGTWCFDAATGDLAGGEGTRRLEPQVARLLAFFLEHPETLVTRDDLIETVWDGRIVSDHAINRCISILRSQLTPDDRNAYIETVVRRGFISHFPPADTDVEDRSQREPATTDDAGRPDPDGPTGSRPGVERRRRRSDRWRPFVLLSLFAFLFLCAVFVQRVWNLSSAPAGEEATPDPPMIAVLPFLTNDQSGESQFFARGIHDDLLTRLAHFQSLRVISRTSVSEYADRTVNIREIGRQLGADAILEGGVQRIGDQIRINMQLIDAKTDAHLWAEQYDRELTPTNIFEIQAGIARSVADALRSTLTLEEAGQLSVIPTQNMAAYRSFHEAMQMRGEVTIRHPAYIAALDRAVELDPGFVRAWVELAGGLSYANINQRDPESMQRLELILEGIRTLAAGSAEHLLAQSYYTYYILKDHARAFELVEQVRALRPGDVQTLELRSWIQRRLGDFDGIVDTLRQVRRLDPRNEYWTARLVNSLVIVHRYDEAANELRNVDVSSLRLSLRRSLLTVRDHGDLARQLVEMRSLEREYDERAVPSDRWDAYIAARDFEGALNVVESFEASGRPGADWGLLSFPDASLSRVITNWFLDGAKPGDPGLAAIRERLEGGAAAGFDTSEGRGGFPPHLQLALAVLSAAEGDRAETTRLIRGWYRAAPDDQAEFVNHRHMTCRVLGMAGAALAAADCLRGGLQAPSWIMPFIEPDLPYYDSIREDAEFRRLANAVGNGDRAQTLSVRGPGEF